MPNKIFDKGSVVFTFIFFFLSLIIFFIDSKKLGQSFVAALLSAALAWLSYGGIRLIYFVFKISLR